MAIRFYKPLSIAPFRLSAWDTAKYRQDCLNKCFMDGLFFLKSLAVLGAILAVLGGVSIPKPVQGFYRSPFLKTRRAGYNHPSPYFSITLRVRADVLAYKIARTRAAALPRTMTSTDPPANAPASPPTTRARPCRLRPWTSGKGPAIGTMTGYRTLKNHRGM
jgi:hypothetical protein